MTVAALYVEKGGVYYGLDDVDPWDEERDARLYAGPWPVVAHPPCARWSRLAGFVEATHGKSGTIEKYRRGNDGGCFEAALAAVNRFGGVLEHPAHSRAFYEYDLPVPRAGGGWHARLSDNGWSCYVEQGRYGLPVKKATWLYAHGCVLPPLDTGWTPDNAGEPGSNDGGFGGMDAWRDRWSSASEPQPGEHERALATHWRGHRHDGLRSATPPAFRDVLLDMARSAARYPAGTTAVPPLSVD